MFELYFINTDYTDLKIRIALNFELIIHSLDSTDSYPTV